MCGSQTWGGTVNCGLLGLHSGFRHGGRKNGAKDKVVRKEGRWAQAARLKQTDKQRKAKGLQTISFGVPTHPDLAAARRDQGIASGPEPSLQGSGAQQGGGAAVASDEAAAHEAAANSSPASVIDPADDQQESTNHADNARPQPQPGIDSDFEVLEDDPDGGEDVPDAEAHANSVQGKYLRIVQLLRAAVEVTKKSTDSSVTDDMIKLSAKPSVIIDRFSASLGDGFHYMDRSKPPMHHECKKPYFVALRDAWYADDLQTLADVVAVQTHSCTVLGGWARTRIRNFRKKLLLPTRKADGPARCGEVGTR